jgi:hypothetical protein
MKDKIDEAIDQLVEVDKSIEDISTRQGFLSYLKRAGVNYVENADGTIDADAVRLLFVKLDRLPVRFGAVDDYFVVHSGLSTLEGCPHTVGGLFNCGENRIASLKGGPKSVGGQYVCSNNPELTSLQGAPDTVNDTFDCSSCKKLTSLKGGSSYVAGLFHCEYCDNLSSLEGAPEEVGMDFVCYGTKLAKEAVKEKVKVGGKIIAVNPNAALFKPSKKPVDKIDAEIDRMVQKEGYHILSVTVQLAKPDASDDEVSTLDDKVEAIAKMTAMDAEVEGNGRHFNFYCASKQQAMEIKKALARYFTTSPEIDANESSVDYIFRPSE